MRITARAMTRVLDRPPFPRGRFDPGRQPTVSARLQALRETLAACAEEDLAAGRGFLWCAVAFAAGIAGYIALPREPALAALAAVLAASLAGALAVRSRPFAFPVLALIAAVACGATAAKLEVTLVAAPTLDRARTAEFAGFVETVERRTGGRARLTIRPVSIEGVAATRLPRRVRVTAAGAATYLPGDAVSLKARLEPPGGPDMPGGYDPARAAFLDGIGATGFAYGRARPADLGPPPWTLAPARAVAEVRRDLAERIRAALPGPRGEVAAALLVGERGGIPEDVEEVMRVSGLAHVLSISGLHMVLVAGTVLWVVRALLAAVPALALTRPIKAWSALVALAAATAYLVLSGADVATQRAYVTMAVALIAVLADRPAISLRTVAVAALVVMALRPSAVLGAGFQMSFAAVIALVAAYEWWSGRERAAAPLPNRAPPMRVLRWIMLGLAGLAATSLIAGLATAPIAAWHFHRGAPLGLLANLVAMPAVSILVMPFGVLALVLIPLGLEPFALAVMGLGLDWMIAVAETVTAWTGPGALVGVVPQPAVLLLVAALLWAAIAVASWRRLAVLPLLAGLALLPAATMPDLLVSADGRAVAVRGPDGRFAVVTADRSARAVRNWLAGDADPRKPAAARAPAAACDDLGCLLHSAVAEASPSPSSTRRWRSSRTAAVRRSSSARYPGRRAAPGHGSSSTARRSAAPAPWRWRSIRRRPAASPHPSAPAATPAVPGSPPRHPSRRHLAGRHLAGRHLGSRGAATVTAAPAPVTALDHGRQHRRRHGNQVASAATA